MGRTWAPKRGALQPRGKGHPRRVWPVSHVRRDTPGHGARGAGLGRGRTWNLVARNPKASSAARLCPARPWEPAVPSVSLCPTTFSSRRPHPESLSCPRLGLSDGYSPLSGVCPQSPPGCSCFDLPGFSCILTLVM